MIEFPWYFNGWLIIYSPLCSSKLFFLFSFHLQNTKEDFLKNVSDVFVHIIKVSCLVSITDLFKTFAIFSK